MKYFFIACSYVCGWTILIPYLVFERIAKVIVILFRILWDFSFKREWLNVFSYYHLFFGIFLRVKVRSVKDLLLFRNYIILNPINDAKQKQ
ncbi:hypothetical protein J2Y60_004942 [Arcicella sp. BE140]|nr:hypothetical protein [Arcicella sp. BE51]MDR6814724.1 hypothetical protein [Arcicella sp. BE140]MDR6826170.1 hypothetical protein [Arcicella sp. BE139]